MKECECVPSCPFFQGRMANMPAMVEIYKQKYCLGEFHECARYMIFIKLGVKAVPADLFPNQKDRALIILELK